MQHALVGVDAGEQDGAHAQVAQDAVQRRVPETADAVLVDADVAGQRREFVHHGGGPGILFQDVAAIARQRITQPGAVPMRLVQVDLVGRHVGQVGPIAPVHPHHGHLRLAQRGQQLAQRLDGRAVAFIVAADVVHPAVLGAEIVLHVDHDDGGALQVDHQVLRCGQQLHGARRRRGHGHVHGARGGAPVVLPGHAQGAGLDLVGDVGGVGNSGHRTSPVITRTRGRVHVDGAWRFIVGRAAPDRAVRRIALHAMAPWAGKRLFMGLGGRSVSETACGIVIATGDVAECSN